MKLTIKVVQKKWKDDTLSISPKNTREKRKDQGHIIITITTIITMTMTMTEIVGSEKEIDLIVEIDHETTTQMTIEKKITGRIKIGNIEIDTENIMETCVTTGT